MIKAVIVWITCFFAFFKSERPPNVVIFFVDDMGYGDLGCQGNDTVHTPNIDELASEGVLFKQWISADSICTPSRGALLTGRLPIRLGLSAGLFYQRMLQPLSPGGLQLEEHTLAEALKERGYDTHLSGKWHLGIGKDQKYLPLAHGFDHFYGMGSTNVQSCMPGKKVFVQDTVYGFMWVNTKAIWLSLFALLVGFYFLKLIGLKSLIGGLIGMIGLYLFAIEVLLRVTLLSNKLCILHKDNEIIQQPIQLNNLTQRVTQDATNFVTDTIEKQTPLFLYMSYHKLHTALFSNDEFKVDDEEEHLEFAYTNNLRELDWSVGHVVNLFKELGEYENTIFWFSSDNGPFLERGVEGGSKKFYELNENGEKEYKQLRGGKAQIWEGGFRVPGIGVYKKMFPVGKVTNEAVSTMDIFPSTLRLVDEAIGKEKSSNLTYSVDKPHTILDGKDITDLIMSLDSSNPQTTPHLDMIHYCGEVLSAVRIDGRYKAYLFTPIFQEEEAETCVDQSSCQCLGSSVQEHIPPIIFDLETNIEETIELTRETFSKYDEIQNRVSSAIQTHLKSMQEYPNQESQVKRMQQITLYPYVCCNFPTCICDNDPYTDRT